MAKTGDSLFDLIEGLNHRVQTLEEAIKPLKLHDQNPDPLALPQDYYIVDQRNGRANAFYRTECFTSTYCWMAAHLACHADDLGMYDVGLHIQWRKLKTGWVWWFTSEINGESIASEDYTSIRSCILASYHANKR